MILPLQEAQAVVCSVWQWKEQGTNIKPVKLENWVISENATPRPCEGDFAARVVEAGWSVIGI